MEPPPGQVTRLLAKIRDGNPAAEDELIPLVYNHLHHLATNAMRRERSDHTLQPTALVHEAYVRLVSQDGADWQDRTHFFRVASRLMRRILVDYSRARRSDKRGGKDEKVALEEVQDASPGGARGLIKLGGVVQLEDLIALDDALKVLGRLHARQEQVVDMRFFGGLTEEEIANGLGLSLRTVKRDWELASAWLYDELCGKAENQR